jgi:O-antigen/teichoic acid export membrane protein
LAYAVFVAVQGHWTFFYLLQAINLLAVLFDISWFFMGIENFRIIALQNTAIKLLTIIGTFAFVHKPTDLWIYILLLAFSTFLGNLAVWPFLRTEIGKIPFKKLQIYKHFKPAMTLFLPQIMITIYLSLNKTMLGSMHSVKSAGYFTQSDSIIRVAYTLTSSFSDAFLPRLSNMVSENKIQEVKGLTLKSLELSNAVGVMIISGIVGISSSFAIYFFGADFKSVGSLMAVESLVILFISWGNVFGKQFLLSTRRMKPYIFSSVFGLTINVLVNLILIPSMGAMGAVIATLMTELGVALYQVWSVRDIFSFKEVFLPLWKYLIAGILSFSAVFTLNQQMSVGLVSYFIQALVCISIYLLVLLVLRARIVLIVRDFLDNIRK